MSDPDRTNDHEPDIDDLDIAERLADEDRELARFVTDALPLTRAIMERLVAENLALEADNASLRRQLGTARLMADLRRDIAEFELSADGPFLPPPFQRQAD